MENEDAEVRVDDSHVIHNEDGSIIVPLDEPLSVGKGTVRELLIPAKITALQMTAMDRGKGELAKMLHMIAEVCDVPYACAGELGASDYQLLASLVGAQMGKSRRTGATSSAT